MKNKIITILGRKGQGKSSLVKYYIVPELNRCLVIDSLAEYSNIIYSSLEEIKPIIKKPSFRIRFLPLNNDEVEELLNFIIDEKIKNVWIIIDEASMYSNIHNTIPSIEYLIKYGRHNQISQIYIARRPQEISRLITAMSDYFILFNTTEKRDLEYIASINEDLPDKVKTLKKLEYLIYDVENQSLTYGNISSFKYLPIRIYNPISQILK